MLLRKVEIAVAWIYREKYEHGPNTMRRAELHLCKWAQKESLGRTLHQLTHDGKVGPSSWLARTKPVLDDMGVIRAQARLHTAIYLSPDARQPVILHPKHPLTKLILLNIHQQINKQQQEIELRQWTARQVEKKNDTLSESVLLIQTTTRWGKKTTV